MKHLIHIVFSAAQRLENMRSMFEKSQVFRLRNTDTEKLLSHCFFQMTFAVFAFFSEWFSVSFFTQNLHLRGKMHFWHFLIKRFKQEFPAVIAGLQTTEKSVYPSRRFVGNGILVGEF
jgi:hypothetical protein